MWVIALVSLLALVFSLHWASWVLQPFHWASNSQVFPIIPRWTHHLIQNEGNNSESINKTSLSRSMCSSGNSALHQNPGWRAQNIVREHRGPVLCLIYFACHQLRKIPADVDALCSISHRRRFSSIFEPPTRSTGSKFERSQRTSSTNTTLPSRRASSISIHGLVLSPPENNVTHACALAVGRFCLRRLPLCPSKNSPQKSSRKSAITSNKYAVVADFCFVFLGSLFA